MRKKMSKMLSIPPYVSTAWENVYNLQLDRTTGALIVALTNGTKITVPGLTGPVIEEIFQGHAEHMEQRTRFPMPPFGPPVQSRGSFTIGIGPQGIGIDGIEGLSGLLQHDPAQADAAPIPHELLDRIAEMAEGLNIEKSPLNLAPPEPDCNCPYCQIASVLFGEQVHTDTLPDVPEINEEALKADPVPPSDLTFREWDITQISDKLYQVSSPLEPKEHYQVFLGDPVGCTCGSSHCEHIVAVLQT